MLEISNHHNHHISPKVSHNIRVLRRCEIPSKDSALLDVYIMAQIYLSITTNKASIEDFKELFEKLPDKINKSLIEDFENFPEKNPYKIKEPSIEDFEELDKKLPEMGRIHFFCKVIGYKFYPKASECSVDAIVSIAVQNISVEMTIFYPEKNGWTTEVLDDLIASEKIAVVKAELWLRHCFKLVDPKIVEVLDEKFNVLVGNRDVVEVKIMDDGQDTA